MSEPKKRDNLPISDEQLCALLQFVEWCKDSETDANVAGEMTAYLLAEYAQLDSDIARESNYIDATVYIGLLNGISTGETSLTAEEVAEYRKGIFEST